MDTQAIDKKSSHKSELVSAYFQRYSIDHMDLHMQAGVVDSAEPVLNLTIKFEPGYQVQFKLQGKWAQLGRHVSSLSKGGLVMTTERSTSTDLDNDLTHFFNSIKSRLDRIEHEERVQNITFLGNTFVLNNKTVFDVVEDEGGRLTIEMHRGSQRQSAKLLASSLLDGLYDGSIVLSTT